MLAWPPPRVGETREPWAHPLLRRTPIGRWGGVSTGLHLLALAAMLLWAARFTPPEPIDASQSVAMVFAPAARPALPPAVPTDRAAAPAPLAPPPPPPEAARPPSETAPPAPPPMPPVADAAPAPPMAPPAPSADPVQAMTPPPPPPPPKPTERPHPAHPAPTRMAKANPSQTSAARAPAAAPSPPAEPPAGPQLATAALVPPHPLSAAAGNHAPLYPVAAMRRREQGRVVLDVDVTADGRADTVRVASSSGFPALDRAAIEAVRLWRFNPATRGGTPVPAVAEVPFNFTLSQ